MLECNFLINFRVRSLKVKQASGVFVFKIAALEGVKNTVLRLQINAKVGCRMCTSALPLSRGEFCKQENKFKCGC